MVQQHERKRTSTVAIVENLYSHRFDCLRGHGISYQLTVSYSPSQNGVAERKNRNLLEITCSMLSEAGLSQKIWGEAINTGTHLQNRLPSKETNRTPTRSVQKKTQFTLATCFFVVNPIFA